MVQLKYYGDDRDYFKYDLISHVLQSGVFECYGFVPLLTEHRYDNEGNIPPKLSNCKSKELLTFISTHGQPDLNNWESWLKNYISIYKVLQPVNNTYYSGTNTSVYWENHQDIIGASNAFIFFDPDTGVQAGRVTRIKEAEKEKYILNHDMPHLISRLQTTSAFVIYQHLQRNRNRHELDITNKLKAISAIDDTLKTKIYREKDLAFIFITKNDSLLKTLSESLTHYNDRSTVNPRGLY